MQNYIIVSIMFISVRNRGRVWRVFSDAGAVRGGWRRRRRRRLVVARSATTDHVPGSSSTLPVTSRVRRLARQGAAFTRVAAPLRARGSRQLALDRRAPAPSRSLRLQYGELVGSCVLSGTSESDQETSVTRLYFAY